MGHSKWFESVRDRMPGTATFVVFMALQGLDFNALIDVYSLVRMKLRAVTDGMPFISKPHMTEELAGDIESLFQDWVEHDDMSDASHTFYEEMVAITDWVGIARWYLDDYLSDEGEYAKAYNQARYD